MNSEEQDYEEFTGEKFPDLKGKPLVDSPVYFLAKRWFELNPVSEEDRNNYYLDNEVQKLALIESVLYHKDRKYYDEVIFQTVTALQNEGAVLDFGCGTGNTSLRLAEKGFKVYALDLDTLTLKFMKWRSRKYNFNIIFIKDLSEVREKINFLICEDVIEHLDNPWSVIEKFSNIVEDGKYLFMKWDTDDPYEEGFHPYHISKRPKEYWIKMVALGFDSFFSKVKIGENELQNFYFWKKRISA